MRLGLIECLPKYKFGYGGSYFLDIEDF